jgi:6-phosphofructokinase
MDNDVFGTDYCIGFSTAVSRSVEAINALRTTVESHERIGVVELFGRRSGETALLSGYLRRSTARSFPKCRPTSTACCRCWPRTRAPTPPIMRCASSPKAR